MGYETQITIGSLAVFLLIMFGGFSLIYFIDQASCHAKWGPSADYAILAGCTLNGIPVDHIRFEVK